MALKVTRYGGPMAGMKPKVKVFQMEDLDPSTADALNSLLEKGGPNSVAERIPDAFVYAFEVDEASGKTKEAEVGSTKVPDALRKLLP
ncbi:protealysin inhibitor emfourin [Bradyrhizobium betae]|uniref:protealysin inhibitor emfourin n=1 Tax=Bradyrhizobium betae TaxID=244734 RepID=UPI003D675B84